MRLSTRFPFGLFRYSMNCGTSATLTVLPRLGRLTQSWNALRHESFAGNDRREHRPGIDGDFYGLRPWQRGDSRRWIHWRTSARAGGVMVRQFEQPHSRDAAIVLDLWQPAAPDASRRGKRRVGREFRRHVGCRALPQGKQRRVPGGRRSRAAGHAAAPARQPCCKT